MAYTAYVFARPGGAAIIPGSPEGHVGFGFQIADDGTTTVGAVEVKDGSTSHINNAMDFWEKDTTDPKLSMGTENPYGRKTRYDMCKIVEVPAPNIAAAQAAIKRIQSIDYNLFSQNCRTDTVEILQAFGVTGLPGGARPAGLIGAMRGPIVPLVDPWPGIDLDFSIYTETDQFGMRDDPDPNAQGYVAEPTADINPLFADGPHPVLASYLLRKGYLTLFSEQLFTGGTVTVGAGSVLNYTQLPWPDKTVRSWYASTTPFEPYEITKRANSIVSRFSSANDRLAHVQTMALPPYFPQTPQ